MAEGITVLVQPRDDPRHEAAWHGFVSSLTDPLERLFLFEADRAPERYRESLRNLARYARGERLPQGLAPFERWWLMDADERTVLGVGSLRLADTPDIIDYYGHIGYTVSPRYRGRGYGTELCRRLMARAASIGMSRVLITCDDDNLASARIIVKCGGVLEDQRTDRYSGKTKRRYWAEVPAHAPGSPDAPIRREST